VPKLVDSYVNGELPIDHYVTHHFQVIRHPSSHPKGSKEWMVAISSVSVTFKAWEMMMMMMMMMYVVWSSSL